MTKNRPGATNTGAVRWDFSQTIDSHPTTTKGYCSFMVA